MARTYLEIQDEIAQLRQAAVTARQKEVNEVIGRIKAAIKAYGLTARDLGLAPGAGPQARAAGYRNAAGKTLDRLRA